MDSLRYSGCPISKCSYCVLNFQIKDVSKYTEDLHKTHKQVKDEESATADSVKLLQVFIFSQFVFVPLIFIECIERKLFVRTGVDYWKCFYIMGQTRPLYLFISSFSQYNDKYNTKDYKWKKHKWCA